MKARPKSILFITPPESGHLLPTIGVAQDLVDMSHKVMYLTSAFFASFLESHGFDSIPFLPAHIESKEMSDSSWTYWYRFSEFYNTSRSDALITIIKSIVNHYDIAGIVADSLFVEHYGKNLSEYLESIPCCTLGITLNNWDQTEINNSGITKIYLCPSIFELPHLLDRRLNSHYAEPSIYAYEGIGAAKRDTDASMQILIAFGTQSAMHPRAAVRERLFIDLAQHNPHIRFTLASGRNGSPVRNKYPDNILVYKTIPQLKLLQQMDLFITHGGLSSIKEAIISKVPMIVLPTLFDQPFNSLRVEHHGLGTAIFEEELCLERLTGALAEVSSSKAVQASLAKFQRVFREAQTSRRAAQLIVEALS